MVPTAGERAPAFEALYCDETFRPTTLDAMLDGEPGCVLVFFGFTGSVIAENWWKRYDWAGWDEFDVPVVGVSRDGPYSQNAFCRRIESPFAFLSDVEGTVAGAYDLLTERAGMAGVRTARRAVFVLEADRCVAETWVADDWISPPPREALEASTRALGH
jgi:peroxiredoxin